MLSPWLLAIYCLMMAGCGTPPSTVGPAASSAATVDTQPAAPATRVETLPDQEIETLVASLLDRMDTRQLIAQRFVTFVPTERPVAKFRKVVARAPVGGIIIYPWNFSGLSDLSDRIERLDAAARQATGGIGLLVTLDQEGGRVRTIRSPDIVQLPPAHFVGRHRDPDLVEALAYANGVELRRLGVNANLAPVLDLYALGDRTIIGDRSYGASPELVARIGAAYIRGSNRAGIVAVPKHFPGHGVSIVDSHGRLPISALDWGELESSHALPFQHAIDAGAEAIMTAHILFPRIDPDYPVTLSEEFLRGILRQRMGFEGVIITDAIEMGAISRHFSTKEMVRRAFTGGVDIILVHNRLDVTELVDVTMGLVRFGYLTEEELRESARRILLLKGRYGLLPEN